MSAFAGEVDVRTTRPKHRVTKRGTAAELGYRARSGAWLFLLEWHVVECACGRGFLRETPYQALYACYTHFLEESEVTK